MKRILPLLFALFLAFGFVADGFAQRSFGRSGGFGGGRSSSGFGRSSGGFGGGFGRSSSPSYSSPRYSGPSSSGSSSFGRSGGFGNSGRVNSSSANPSRNYGGYSAPSRFNYGGTSYNYYGGGGGFLSGYALGTLTSPWTHWVPFHPGFYVNRPYYDNGAYYGGGFSFTRFILGIAIIGFLVWLALRLFGGGSGSGGKRYKYTNYR